MELCQRMKNVPLLLLLPLLCQVFCHRCAIAGGSLTNFSSSIYTAAAQRINDVAAADGAREKPYLCAHCLITNEKAKEKLLPLLLQFDSMENKMSNSKRNSN